MSACANKKPKRPEIKEYFVTNIKEDGSKHFSYSLIMKMPSKRKNSDMTARKNKEKGGGTSQNGRKSNGTAGRNSNGGHIKNKANNTARLAQIENNFYEMLDAKLIATAFCRDGYFTLDSYIGKDQSQLRGECNEAAEAMPNE